MSYLWPPSLWFLPKRKHDHIQYLSELTAGQQPLRTLIHVGAHLAQERDEYEALGYQDILWVEGSPGVYRRLAENLETNAGNGTCRHRAVCALLTDREGDEVTLRECSNDGMSSSIFPLTAEATAQWTGVRETGAGETVQTRTLDSIAAEFQMIDKIDTLVVDVQGAELLVLKGGEKVLQRARAVISEISSEPFYEGGVLFPELCQFLRRRGFMPTSRPTRHGDLLFVRAR